MYKVTLLLVVLLCFTSSIYCWGVDGHQIVAQIASAFVTPTTSNSLQRMLNGYTLANISTWPDNYDHTSVGAWSERYHYVNMDSNAINFTYAECFQPGEPPGCVITAITNSTQILKEDLVHNYWEQCTHPDNTTLPCQLSFLVHFLGDAHQPLHVGYSVDEGGNEVHIQYYTTCSSLHGIWDNNILETYESNNHLNWYGVAESLVAFLKQSPNLVDQFLNKTEPSIWGDETFSLCRFVPYNFSPANIPNSIYWFDEYYNTTIKVPDYPNAPVVFPSQNCGPILSTNYYTRTIPVVIEQLARAGIRLAYQLNMIYDSTFFH